MLCHWGFGKWQKWRGSCSVLPVSHQLLFKTRCRGGYTWESCSYTDMLLYKTTCWGLYSWKSALSLQVICYCTKWEVEVCTVYSWESTLSSSQVIQAQPRLYSCLALLSSPSPEHVNYTVSGTLYFHCTVYLEYHRNWAQPERDQGSSQVGKLQWAKKFFSSLATSGFILATFGSNYC